MNKFKHLLSSISYISVMSEVLVSLGMCVVEADVEARLCLTVYFRVNNPVIEYLHITDR